VVTACLLLLIAPLVLGKRRRLPALLLLMLAFCLCFAPQLPADELELTMLDVGQGEAMLIVTPQGRTVLLDGGGHSFDGGYDADIGPYLLLPYLKSRGIDRIDIIISSHAHADHYSGLISVLEQLPVGEFWYAPAAETAQTRLLAAAADNGAKIVVLEQGMDFTDAEGLRWQVWGPQEYTADNAASLILSLSYGAVDMLLTGDAEEAVEQYLLTTYGAQGLDCDLLKAGHHGSQTSSSEELLKALTPTYVTISCGKGNPYGHPMQQVLDRIAAVGARACRTDREGSLVFVSDGKTLVLRTK
jgi:competence protein ComEC